MPTTAHGLGVLADPTRFHEPLEITGRDPFELRQMLTEMVRIRLVETLLADRRSKGLIGGPVHLGVGQEAVAVGVSASLRSTDRVFGAHRSHSHLLALGSEAGPLFAEVLGRDTGFSRGMGGSMHLWNQPKGFYGSTPIVAGTVSLAVGAGLAAKLQGKQDVAVSYLGDGAMEEGVVHESLNLARQFGVPVVFVVENNLFSSHMHISQRQPLDSVARFAVANDMRCHVIDGNDVLAVSEAAADLVDAARDGRGPGFLEAVTYRWLGHVDWRDDIDVGVSRSVKDLANWKGRDPIRRLAEALTAAGHLGADDLAGMSAAVQTGLEAEWDEATLAPYPAADSLMTRVFAGGSDA